MSENREIVEVELDVRVRVYLDEENGITDKEKAHSYADHFLRQCIERTFYRDTFSGDNRHFRIQDTDAPVSKYVKFFNDEDEEVR